MKKLFAAIAAFSMIAGSAYALDLQEARAKGLVGETQAGYVARISGGGDVSQLVGDVNLKRRAEYEKIATEKGQTVEVVAKVAAGTIINNLPAGAKYKDASGKWATK